MIPSATMDVDVDESWQQHVVAEVHIGHSVTLSRPKIHEAAVPNL